MSDYMAQQMDSKIEGAQYTHEAMLDRLAELEAALQKIADWQSHSSEFSVDHGSNGVRDFYRLIAKQALKGQP